MILRLCLNEMMLQFGEHELSLRQRQPDGPRRILVNSRTAANLVSADGPIRPGYLHHDPPLHPAPRFADKADRSTSRFWTVSCVKSARFVLASMSALPPGHAEGCIDAFRTVVLQGRLAMQDVSRRYPSFADGLHDVRLVEAAIRRAADRRTVEVET
jgi:hypothetical protein